MYASTYECSIPALKISFVCSLLYLRSLSLSLRSCRHEGKGLLKQVRFRNAALASFSYSLTHKLLRITPKGLWNRKDISLLVKRGGEFLGGRGNSVRTKPLHFQPFHSLSGKEPAWKIPPPLVKKTVFFFLHSNPFKIPAHIKCQMQKKSSKSKVVTLQPQQWLSSICHKKSNFITSAL